MNYFFHPLSFRQITFYITFLCLPSDLTPAFQIWGLRALFLQRQQQDSENMYAAMKPFHWKTWAAFLFLWIFFSLILRIISVLGKKICRRSMQSENHFSFFQCLWYFVLLSVQSGSDKQPKSVGGKILSFSWTAFMIVVLATYTANLAAFFTNEPPLRPLISISDLKESNHQVSTYDFFEHYFSDFDNPFLSSLMKKGRLSFEVSDNETFIDQVRTVLHDGKAWIDQNRISFIQKEIPEAYVLDGFISFQTIGFAMRKHWYWTDELSRLFIKYGQSGFFYEVMQNYKEKKPRADFHPNSAITAG